MTASTAVARLYGREAVQDLERCEAAGLIGQADTEIERLGITFQIATRATAWVALSEERTVDPTAPIRRERIPHAVPYGMSVESLGLRPARMPSFLCESIASRQQCGDPWLGHFLTDAGQVPAD